MVKLGVNIDHVATLRQARLAGEPDPEIGRFVNLEEVAEWFEREVIVQLDHRNLNVEVPFLDGVIPTAENIARVLAQLLRDGPHGRHLYEVRLCESENNAARVRAADLPRRARDARVRPEHDVGVQHRQQRPEVAVSRGRQERVHDLPLTGGVGGG